MGNPSTLAIHFKPDDGGEIPGSEIRCVGPVRAALTGTGDQLSLTMALSAAPLTETRWSVDRAMRQLNATFEVSSSTISFDDELSDDIAIALGLDLRSRLGSEVPMTARARATEETNRVQSLENLFKSWVDEDPSTRTSLAIAADVEAMAAELEHVSCEVFAEDELRQHGMNLLLAVGGGSEASPARLVMAHYRPPGSDRAPLMLLGKGVTFDTGGINVKPYESFVSMMKNDMAGAALANALFRALASGGYPHPVSLVLPTCENAVGARSMRPGSVVRSYRGIDVRIDHTDAEGRLILADGLAYASDTLEPELILSFATLTTAALIAYGPFATPVHFADERLQTALSKASEQCGEDLHFFPERIWHFEANRDKEADIRNTAQLPGNASRAAGSRNAAHFLKHFSTRPLVHFDIFASTWNWSGEAPGAGYGATGAPFRTLLRALESRGTDE